ncbi:type II toxin-antitoxin system VapB family antitoxin [Lunatibacter salilacus]|nr:type II toxin-antitoxin system VapB family antitoxin [Lunatibacter salilacus]
MSKLKTKKDVVHEALEQYVASLKKKQLLSLREKDSWVGDFRQMGEM